MKAIIGQRVEVRRGIDDAGVVYIFSLPDKKPLFEATCLAYSGNVQEDIARLNKLKKEGDALFKKYNKKKAEYDAEFINTPAENHALKEPVMLRVVNGEPLVVDEGKPVPHLRLVKTGEPADKPKRKLKGIFDD
jgi:hypothetical protein